MRSCAPRSYKISTAAESITTIFCGGSFKAISFPNPSVISKGNVDEPELFASVSTCKPAFESSAQPIIKNIQTIINFRIKMFFNIVNLNVLITNQLKRPHNKTVRPQNSSEQDSPLRADINVSYII